MQNSSVVGLPSSVIFALSYNFLNLFEVISVVFQSQDKSRERIARFALGRVLVRVLQIRFVGPHVETREPDAPAFFETMATLRDGRHGLPRHFDARTSAAKRYTARKFARDGGGFFR